MKRSVHLLRRIKRTYLFTTGAILGAALLFAPVFPRFERTGDNFFSVRLNGQEVGICGDVGRIGELIVRARRQIAGQSDELVYIPTTLETKGKEVLFGRVDGEGKLYENVLRIMRDSVQETIRHAYTVKINEYMVNLPDSQDVCSLMQAVLDRYDTGRIFQVGLSVDPDRELNVLTTSITRRDQEEGSVRSAGYGSGVGAYFEEVFAQIEPDAQKSDFSSLDYGLTEIDFDGAIEVVDAYLTENEISSLESAVLEVTADQETEKIYEVKSGDTLSQIAEDNGITMEELIAVNPLLEDSDTVIRVGDELKITMPEPELSVVYKARVYEESSYEEPTVYVENDDWYTTRSEVRIQPSAGYRKAAALVTYRNGAPVSEEIVKEEILYEAVAKVVERGTKIPPTYIRPISGGRVSSGFGKRKSPTKGASANHQGVDWAVPVGTAVMASSGGTVTKAGWGSGYGYVVYIRHDDGRETRYGHLSKVLVKAGQKVSQGQKIALSGNTGRSTGPHLHFEMRINGSAVNPLKYV